MRNMGPERNGPKTVVVGGTCSGVGKTSLVVAIMTVLRWNIHQAAALPAHDASLLMLTLRDAGNAGGEV